MFYFMLAWVSCETSRRVVGDIGLDRICLTTHTLQDILAVLWKWNVITLMWRHCNSCTSWLFLTVSLSTTVRSCANMRGLSLSLHLIDWTHTPNDPYRRDHCDFCRPFHKTLFVDALKDLHFPIGLLLKNQEIRLSYNTVWANLTILIT